MSSLKFFVALVCYLQLINCAPAPVLTTIWETVTSTSTSSTGIPTGTGLVAANTLAATAANNAPTGTSTTQATATTSSSFWDSFLQALSPSTSAGAGATAATTTPNSTSGSTNTFAQWLSKIFGGDSSASTTSSSSSNSDGSSFWTKLGELLLGSGNTSAAASTAPSTTQPVATVASSPIDSSAQTPISIYSPTSSSSFSTYTPQPSSSTPSNGDIYAAISQCDGIDPSFATAILDAHNKDRAAHQAGSLSWDVDTYNYAKNNADNYDCSGILTHTHGQYGENLAAGYPDGPSAVEAWYVEGEQYDYSLQNTYDHFTQVVWKSSTKVGCAYKNCKKENWGLYIVCEYDPPGNIIGQNRANVLPLSS